MRKEILDRLRITTGRSLQKLRCVEIVVHHVASHIFLSALAQRSSASIWHFSRI
jgi:hypothetical protein